MSGCVTEISHRADTPFGNGWEGASLYHSKRADTVLAKLAHTLKPKGTDMTKSINTPARRILGLAVAATLGVAAIPATAMDANNPVPTLSSNSSHGGAGPIEHPVSTKDTVRR